MKQPHLLVERESQGILIMKILCPGCMHTWWTEREDLNRELRCRRCGRRARVETDRTKMLR